MVDTMVRRSILTKQAADFELSLPKAGLEDGRCPLMYLAILASILRQNSVISLPILLVQVFQNWQ